MISNGKIHALRRKALAGAVAAALVVCTGGLGQRAHAMMAGPASEAAASTRADDLASVRQSLESRIVRGHLADLGLTPAQVETRLSRLGDQDLHRVATAIERERPAGDAGTIAIVAAGVVLFIVLIAKLLVDDDDDGDGEVDVDDDDGDDAVDLDDNDDDGGTNVQQQAPANGNQGGPETIIVK